MAHKSAHNDLTADYVRDLFDYNPETGVLTRKKARYRRPKSIGEPVGAPHPIKGDIRTTINGRFYGVHRLIWLIQTGEWPPEEIDHIDRDPSNNRWANLRLATSSQNQANRHVHSNNTTGFRGVYYRRRIGRYTAEIQYKKQREYLGCFTTAEEAYAVRCARAKELFGEFYEAHVKA